MKVLLDNDSDRFKLNLQDRSFEWSYFESDFIFNNDKYNLVIIASNGLFVNSDFYESNIKPNINVVLTKNKEIISFSFKNFENISFEKSILSIGDSLTISYSSNGERILYFKLKDLKDAQIEGSLVFIPKEGNNISNISSPSTQEDKINFPFFSDIKDELEWGLSNLNYETSGKINLDQNEIVIPNKSIGYHDYNYCKNADTFYKNISEWVWWKSQSKDFQLIFFELDNKGKKGNSLLLKVNNKLQTYTDVEVFQKYARTNLFLKYPKSIKIENKKDNFSINLEEDHDLDYKVSVLGIKFSGLFYTRRQYKVTFMHKGETFKSCATLEIFKPKRLTFKLIRYAFSQGLYKQRRNIFSKIFFR